MANECGSKLPCKECDRLERCDYISDETYAEIINENNNELAREGLEYYNKYMKEEK